jgi:hypothetical protein
MLQYETILNLSLAELEAISFVCQQCHTEITIKLERVTGADAVDTSTPDQSFNCSRCGQSIAGGRDFLRAFQNLKQAAEKSGARFRIKVPPAPAGEVGRAGTVNQ